MTCDGVEVMTGGWLVAALATTTVYVWVAIPPWPSSTWMATFCEPTWVASGLQWMNPLCGSMVMPVGNVVRLKVSGSFSGSVARTA